MKVQISGVVGGQFVLRVILADLTHSPLDQRSQLVDAAVMLTAHDQLRRGKLLLY